MRRPATRLLPCLALLLCPLPGRAEDDPVQAALDAGARALGERMVALEKRLPDLGVREDGAPVLQVDEVMNRSAVRLESEQARAELVKRLQAAAPGWSVRAPRQGVAPPQLRLRAELLGSGREPVWSLALRDEREDRLLEQIVTGEPGLLRGLLEALPKQLEGRWPVKGTAPCVRVAEVVNRTTARRDTRLDVAHLQRAFLSAGWEVAPWREERDDPAVLPVEATARLQLSSRSDDQATTYELTLTLTSAEDGRELLSVRAEERVPRPAEPGRRE